MADVPTTFQLGEYVLERPLGRGGMAEVWLARHQALPEVEVAVKVVTGAKARGDFEYDAFFTEARAHASLEHPNIVRLLDYGHVGPSDSPPEGVAAGAPYLVMERADGTLRDVHPLRGYAEAARALLSILDALAYSHARGVIHRDLKPENVLTFRRGDDVIYKLADFGIAHPMRMHRDTAPTSESQIVGTPGYMPQEQLRSRSMEFGPWTDLYALGCMAFQLVDGQQPFTAKSFVELAQLHMFQPPRSLKPMWPVPERYESWIRRLLEKEPTDRYRWAADAAHALFSLSSGFDSSLPGDGIAAPQEDAAPTLADSTLMLGLADTAAFEGVLAATQPHETSPETVVPLAVVSSPMPLRWGSGTARAATRHEGLGLFALRQLRVVGLSDERTRLWRALQQVDESRRASVVVLEGGEEAPLDALAEWLVVRASEVGAASPLRIRLSHAGGPREGLVTLAEDYFNVGMAEFSRIEDRIRAVSAGTTHPDLVESRVEMFRNEIGRSRGEDLPPPRGTRRERFEAYTHLVRTLATDRRVIVAIENAQWSAESIAFASHLMDSENLGPCLILVTVRTGDLDPASMEARALAELEAHPNAEVLALDPYDREERRQLVDAMLPLDDETKELVAERFGYDSLLARTAIAEMIERGTLQRTDGGFRFARQSLPEWSHDLFEARILGVLRRFDAPEEASKVLEIAATLGRSPDPRELEAVCASRSIELPTGFANRLADAGLVDEHAHGGWSFVHRDIVAVLEERARRLGRLRLWHRACAETLEARSNRDTGSVLLRTAAHWRAAEAPRRALSAIVAALRTLQAVDPPRARQLVRDGHSLVADQGLESTDVLLIDFINAEAMVFAQDRRYELAAERATTARSLAEAVGYLRGQADAGRTLARVAMGRGNFVEGVETLRAVLPILERLGDAAERASCELHAGWATFRLGNFEDAERHYHVAAATYSELGMREQFASVLSYLAALSTARAEFDAAEEHASNALEAARACGSTIVIAEAVSDLAEISRFRGDLVMAKERYLEATRWRELLGGEKRFVSSLNLGLVALAEGDFDTAFDTLPSLSDRGGDVDPDGYSDVLTLARAGCLLGLQREEDFEALYRPMAAELEVREEADRDVAWTLEQLAGVAIAAGRKGLAREVGEFASQEYARLGDTMGAERTARLGD